MFASETLFSILGNSILAGWFCVVISVFLPRRHVLKSRLVVLGGVIIPAILATLPVWFALFGPQSRAGDLFSLVGILERFENPAVLMLLYFEALAFALFVAGLIARDSEHQAIPRWITAPNLVLLFFKGPIGVLTYAGSRQLAVLIRNRRDRPSGLDN